MGGKRLQLIGVRRTSTEALLDPGARDGPDSQPVVVIRPDEVGYEEIPGTADARMVNPR